MSVGTFAQAPPQRKVFLTAHVKDGSRVTQLLPSDLKAGDARIVSVEPATDVPLAVAFLVDNSGSARLAARDKSLATSELIKRLLRPDVDSAMLVNFNEQIYLDQQFTTSPALVQTAVDKANNHGGSAIFDSLRAISAYITQHAAAESPHVLVLISDGLDNASSITEYQAIEALQRADIRVYAISFPGGSERGTPSLMRITEATGGRAFRLKTKKDKAADVVIDEISAALTPELRNWWKLTLELPPGSKTKKISISSHNSNIRLEAQKDFFLER